MNATETGEAPKVKPTEWELINFQEQKFARSHVEQIMALLAANGANINPEDMIEETRNLLFIHRGTSIASWMMETARQTGKIFGHDGGPVHPSRSEVYETLVNDQGRPAPAAGQTDQFDASDLIAGLIRAQRDKVVYMDVAGQLYPVKFISETDKIVVLSAVDLTRPPKG